MHSLFWLITIAIVFGKSPLQNDVKQFFTRGYRFRKQNEVKLGEIPLLPQGVEPKVVEPPDAEVPVKTIEGHDPCNAEGNPCLCLNECGWDSDSNLCVTGSTTRCHECATVHEDCLIGVCGDWGCPKTYNSSQVCQCTDNCIKYGNCCKDVTSAHACLTDSFDQMAKIAEDNALPIAIGGLVVILLAGIGLVFWWKRNSDVQESDIEPLPAPRRYHTQKLMSVRSGPYSRIPGTPGTHMGRMMSPDGEFSDYARPLMDSTDSDRLRGHSENNPLLPGSGTSHERAYQSTRRNGSEESNYAEHNRVQWSDLANPPNLAKRTDTGFSSGNFSSILSPRSCDLNAEDFGKGSWQEIGSGQYGEVYSARWFGTTVAVKKGKGGNKSREDMLAEAMQLRDLSHPSLCEFFGVVLLPQEVWLVTRFYQKGSVDKILKREVITMKRKFKWCRQACGGLAFLHSMKLVHRDLACRNLLISKDDDCVIADFGLSRILADNQDRRKTTTNFGPVRWMALESLTQVYSIESDVWMFGVLVWEMLKDGEQPYRKLRNTQVVKQVQKGLRLQLDNKWPPALNEVLSRCWKKDPELRPTATEFLQVLEEITGHTTSPRGRGSVV